MSKNLAFFICWTGLSLAATAALCALSAGPARASGYHPPFDRAVEEAHWILFHTVISDHAPADKLKNLPPGARGRVYLVKVTKVFKGPFKPGEQLLVWDPWYRSTAGYFLNAKGDNLSFLAPPGAQRKYQVKNFGRGRSGSTVRTMKTYGGNARSRDARLKVGVVFRNKSDTVSKGRGHGMKDWMQLLKMTRVGKQRIDLNQARNALRKATGRDLLFYVLTHWPGMLSIRDAALVRTVIKKKLNDAYVTAPAIRLLRKQKHPLAAAQLKHLMVKGSRYARQELLKDVNKSNVKTVREVLWSWIQQDQEGVLPAIRVLGKLEPAFLEKKLKARHLPFWLNVPALRAISKKPQDLGQKPYPAGVMKANEYDLSRLGRLVKGNTFGVWYAAFQARNSGLAPYMTLLLPHFPKMKPRAREVAIAALRTWGYVVKRKGSSIVIGARTVPPLAITLKPVPGQPHKVRMVETAQAPVLLCPKGGKQVRIGMKGGTETSSGGSHSGSFTSTAPRDCFKTQRGVVRDEVVDLSSLLANLHKPGLYNVMVGVVHPYSGTNHGLDGWTGMVFSAPMQLRLPLAAKPAKAAAASSSPKPMATEPRRINKGGCACSGHAANGLPLVLLYLMGFVLLFWPSIRRPGSFSE